MTKSVKELKFLLRPAMLTLTFVLGACFQACFPVSWETPSGTSISLWCIRGTLMVMFYLVLLKIDFRKLVPRREHFPILAANFAMGIVPYIILKYLGYDALALAVFFAGITPTATAAPVVMDFLEGDVEFVLTAFAVTNFFVDLSLIGLLPWVTGNFNCTFLFDVIKQLSLIVLLPLGCALATKFVCKRIQKPVPVLPGMATFTLWCGSLFVIAAQSTLFFQQHREIKLSSILMIAAASFAVCACNFTLGQYSGGRNFRKEAAQSLGQKNTTLTIFLALTFSTPEAALGPTFYVLWHNLWNAYQMYSHDSSKKVPHDER